MGGYRYHTYADIISPNLYNCQKRMQLIEINLFTNSFQKHQYYFYNYYTEINILIEIFFAIQILLPGETLQGRHRRVPKVATL